MFQICEQMVSKWSFLAINLYSLYINKCDRLLQFFKQIKTNIKKILFDFLSVTSQGIDACIAIFLKENFQAAVTLQIIALKHLILHELFLKASEM